MVRMWNIDPRFMCSQHTVGEHCEMHTIVKCIESNRINKVKGHTSRGQLDTSLISQRHRELEEYNGWDSPIDYDDELNLGYIDEERNIRDLMERCEDCREIMKSKSDGIQQKYNIEI